MKHLEDIRLDEELVLKTSRACERLVGSNPTSSVTSRFKGYPIRTARQWEAHLANNRLEDSTTKTTKPRDDTSGLCRIYNHRTKEQCMSPTALPQKPAVHLNPKLAFEALLTNAFKVREEIKQKTAVTMVTLDRLAMKASYQKSPERVGVIDA